MTSLKSGVVVPVNQGTLICSHETVPEWGRYGSTVSVHSELSRVFESHLDAQDRVCCQPGKQKPLFSLIGYSLSSVLWKIGRGGVRERYHMVNGSLDTSIDSVRLLKAAFWFKKFCLCTAVQVLGWVDSWFTDLCTNPV